MRAHIFIVVLMITASCGGGGGNNNSNLAPTQQEEQEADPTEDGIVTFSEFRTSVVVPKCIGCHPTFSQESGVRPVIVPGNPEASLLFQMVESGLMPREETPLTTQQLEIVRIYIEGQAAAVAND